MGKGLKWIPSVFCIGVVLEWVLSVFGEGSGFGNLSNLAVMVIFFIAAGGIYMMSYRYLSVGRDIQVSLENVTREIERLSHTEKEMDILSELQGRKSVFSERRLEQAFRDFESELASMERPGANGIYHAGFKVNIGDYIHEGLIDAAIHSNYLSQIPATLTGLGILGTFFGLSIGLNAFDILGGAAEAEANIGSLMDGMKVAFHTSILGLCYSILYNFFYRRTYSGIMEALDSFLGIFQKYVITSTENGSANTFLKYQAIISETLMAQTALDKKILTSLDLRFGNLAEELRMQSKQALSIYNQINSKIVKSQKEGMRGLVTLFIQEMEGQLKESFQTITAIVESLYGYQQETQEALRISLRQISGMSSNITQTNSSLEHSIHEMKAYMDDVHKMQEALMDNLEAVQDRESLEYKKTEYQVQAMEKLKELQHAIGKSSQEQMQHISDTFSVQQKQVNELLDAFAQNMQGRINDLHKIEDGFVSETKKGIEIISSYARDSKDMLWQELNEGIAGFKDSNKKHMEQMDGIVQSMASSTQENISNICGMLEQLSNDINHGRKEAGDGILRLNATAQEAAQSTETFIRTMRNESQAWAKEIEEGIQKIVSSIDAKAQAPLQEKGISAGDVMLEEALLEGDLSAEGAGEGQSMTGQG